MEERLDWVNLDRVSLHPRARLHDPTKLNELAESLRMQGQLQPCRGRPREGKIEVYIGQGRYLAAKALGWQDIQVLISDRSDEEVDLAMLHENIKREDLDPISEAYEYAYLIEARDWTQGQLAERVGKSQEVVSRTLSLLSLAEEVKDIMRRRIMSKHHGVVLAKLDDKALQWEVAKTVCEGGLSVKQTEDLVNLCRTRGAESTADLPSALSELWSEKTYVGQSSQGPARSMPPEVPSELNKLSSQSRLSLRKLWPNLPPGVFVRLEGGWFVLRCSRLRYSNLKSLLEGLAQSAPEKLPVLTSRRKRRKVKRLAVSSDARLWSHEGNVSPPHLN